MSLSPGSANLRTYSSITAIDTPWHDGNDGNDGNDGSRAESPREQRLLFEAARLSANTHLENFLALRDPNELYHVAREDELIAASEDGDPTYQRKRTLLAWSSLRSDLRVMDDLCASLVSYDKRSLYLIRFFLWSIVFAGGQSICRAMVNDSSSDNLHLDKASASIHSLGAREHHVPETLPHEISSRRTLATEVMALASRDPSIFSSSGWRILRVLFLSGLSINLLFIGLRVSRYLNTAWCQRSIRAFETQVNFGGLQERNRHDLQGAKWNYLWFFNAVMN